MTLLNSITGSLNKPVARFIFAVVVLLFCGYLLLAITGTNLDYSTASFSRSIAIRGILGYNSLNNSRIHIVAVADKDSQVRYRQHSDSMLCYAYRHGYSFSVIDANDYYPCLSMSHFFFRKHCAVMLYLIQNPDIQWFLVLDGDTFVVNATRSLKQFIPDDPNIHVVHYERFRTNEIMAGNYIIRNHPWSLLYLKRWFELFPKLPAVVYHNYDNGALHLHFVDMMGKLDNYTYQRCFAVYNHSNSEHVYLSYVACNKCALKGQKRFLHAILYRRGHFFIRDSGLWEDKIHQLDIILHGYKHNLNHFYEEPVNSSTCKNDPNWTPKLRQSLLVPDLSAAKILISQWERAVSGAHPETNAYPEIADCWPNCEPNITGVKLHNYTSALCKYDKPL